MRPSSRRLAQDSLCSPLDSLSISHNQDSPKTPQEKTGSHFKPLLALNIDIGEAQPAKILVYDFTDPWKRAYEFIHAYELPEEMHEEVATLIENAKDAKLKEKKMQKRNFDKHNGSRFAKGPSVFVTKADKKRRTSVDVDRSRITEESDLNDVSNSQIAKEMNAVKSNQSKCFAQERNKSLIPPYKKSKEEDFMNSKELFGSTCVNESCDKEVKKEGDNSNILDSTALLSTISDKNRTKSCLGSSPFASQLQESGDDWRQSLQTKVLSPKSNKLVLSDVKKPKINDKITPEETLRREELIKKLFIAIDDQGTGTIKPFQIYLSYLSYSTKQTLLSILQTLEPNPSLSDPTLYDFSTFRLALLESPLLSSLSLK